MDTDIFSVPDMIWFIKKYDMLNVTANSNTDAGCGFVDHMMICVHFPYGLGHRALFLHDMIAQKVFVSIEGFVTVNH